MGREDHGTPFRTDFTDKIMNLDTGLGVESGRRLVQDDQPGIPDQGKCQVQPLTLAAGKVLEAGALAIVKSESLQNPPDPLTVYSRIERPEKRYDLAHGSII
jgi:hypothetical protein